VPPAAPWAIKAEDLAGFAKKKRRQRPLTANATQQILDRIRAIGVKA
jgi:hypothetical protein